VKKSGFTILEILMASAITIFVIGVAYSFLADIQKTAIVSSTKNETTLEISPFFVRLESYMRSVPPIFEEESLSVGDGFYRGIATVATPSSGAPLCMDSNPAEDNPKQQIIFTALRSTAIDPNVFPVQILRLWNHAVASPPPPPALIPPLLNANTVRIQINPNKKSALENYPLGSEVYLFDADGKKAKRFIVKQVQQYDNVTIDPYTNASGGPANSWAELELDLPTSFDGMAEPEVDFNFISHSLLYKVKTEIVCVDKETRHKIISVDQAGTVSELVALPKTVTFMQFTVEFGNRQATSLPGTGTYQRFENLSAVKRPCLNGLLITIDSRVQSGTNYSTDHRERVIELKNFISGRGAVCDTPAAL
jgi:hypothetical protein